MENKKNDTSDRELRLSRVLDAPVELVWEVWTHPQHLAQWWGPDGFTNTIDHMDIRPGGEWKLVMHGPDGRDYPNRSVFREVVPFKRIVYDHVNGPKFTATVEFEARGQQTFMSWHMVFETAEVFLYTVKTFGADEGQKQNVERLGRYLAARRAMPTSAGGLVGSGHAAGGPVGSGYAPVNGIRMYYEVHGQGEMPLVLIHGGGSTIETTFHYLLPLLSRGRRVIAVELQAHGRTSDREGPETFQQDADDVAALMRHVGVDKADVLGFSNGASTTLQIAIRHPELVHKIVVVSGAYRRDGFIPGFFDGFDSWSLDSVPAELKEGFLRLVPDETKMMVMLQKDVQRMIHFADWSDDDLRSIGAPAMILSSDRDVVTPEHSVRMSRLIAGSRLVILPGGHGALVGAVEIGVGKGHGDVVAQLVEDFLSDR